MKNPSSFPIRALVSVSTLAVCLTLMGCGGSSQSNPVDSSIESNNTLAAALAGSPENTGGIDASEPITNGLFESLTDDEFNSLTVLEQYQIANKILATLYRGMSVDEFFVLEDGLEAPKRRIPSNWLSNFKRSLETALPQEELLQLDLEILGSDEFDGDLVSDEVVEPLYTFSRQRPREIPLARIFHYPYSSNLYSQWMSWTLANTILFSPAAELDSVDMTDVQNVFRRLEKGILAGEPVREIVYQHMRSQENWRRFRSPEDNTREMIEIFLGMEDLDDEIPAASKACQDLYLTEENQGYLLAYTDFPNTEQQTVLEKQVISCDDFYAVVANHEELLPTVAEVLVRHFFQDREFSFQVAAAGALMQQNPQSFSDLFTAILFSREYLLKNERLKSFEEAYLGTAMKIRWRTREDLFRGLVSGNGGSGRTHMSEMGWPAMTAKLGRISGVATDSLSFANFHKGLREGMLIADWRWRENFGISEPDAPDPKPITPPPTNASAQAISDYNTVLANYHEGVDALPANERKEYDRELQRYFENLTLFDKVKNLDLAEFIDYVFISIASRKSLPVERQELIAIFDNEGFLRIEEEGIYLNKWSRSGAARITMDYLSRLPEIYYLKRVGE